MLALVTALLLLPAPATAQPASNRLVERMQAIDPATATPAACEERIAQAPALNGPDLFHASAICFHAGRLVEGSFLLNAGQTRSIADMALIVPATRADSEKQAELYGFIYFSAGGPGSDEVFRDPALRARFWRLYDAWSPAFGPAYDPGWNARRSPDAAAYRSAIAEISEGRRRQLNEIARLYADDAYYALHRRMQELQARTQGRYVEGTADYDLSRDLDRQMNERAVALGLRERASPPEPGDQSLPPMPPASPAADETVQPAASDPVSRRCAEMAERMTIAAESQIARVLVTVSPTWGVIWRADLTGGRDPAMRFTCSARTTASEPLGEGPGAIAPLPDRPPAASGTTLTVSATSPPAP
ncbi:MAG TPA: hypothetical protein VEC11_14770 [Allosphingosinicella sp.]|nr:hypothetical protein [Allosphingosinicella sp.]